MEVMKDPDKHAETISQWVGSYEKELLRLCCLYLKDVALAEDAVQETFWKAYRACPASGATAAPGHGSSASPSTCGM